MQFMFMKNIANSQNGTNCFNSARKSPGPLAGLSLSKLQLPLLLHIPSALHRLTSCCSDSSLPSLTETWLACCLQSCLLIPLKQLTRERGGLAVINSQPARSGGRRQLQIATSSTKINSLTPNTILGILKAAEKYIFIKVLRKMLLARELG